MSPVASSTSPYKDIQPAHAAALQPLWKRSEGVRLTELAQIARITKQSMGALVDSMEAGGYMERVADPDDGRAYGRDVRKFSRQVEQRIEERIGAEKIEALRSNLQLLVDSLQTD